MASVESSRFPYLPIEINIGDHTRIVDALIDTGFDDYVIVPEGFVPLEEEPAGTTTLEVGGGALLTRPFYYGIARVGDLETVPARFIVLGGQGAEFIVGRDRPTSTPLPSITAGGWSSRPE